MYFITRAVCPFRFNLTQLEEWCRTNQLNSDEILKPLDPIKEATQLLQVNKKSLDDVDSILSVCSTLNPLQVRQLVICSSGLLLL